MGSFEELQNDPHLQGVLEINKKNLTESTQMQQNAITASNNQLLLSSPNRPSETSAYDPKNAGLLGSTMSD